MKNLLSMLAVSMLVGTSVSSLKPVFITNNLVSHGFKSNQLNNKNISIQGENSVNPFINKIKTLDDNSNVSSSVKSSNGTIYVGTYKSGLYKSADGITFEKVNGLPNDVSAIATFNKTVYVSTQKSGLWKSIDGIKFIKTSFVGLYTSSIATDSNGNIYVENLGVLYKSDNGITFESIKTVPNDVEDISTFGKIVYVGTKKKGLWKSADGITFEKVNGLPNDFVIQKIHITLNGTIYAGSSASGLYKSADGITFEKVNGLPNEKIRSIASNSNLIVIGFDNGKIYKSDNGIAFNQIYQIDNYIVVNVTNDGTIYVGTEKKGLWIINSLLKINQPNYFGNLFDGVIYNSVQKIDIKENLVASAKLDGNSITIPSTDVNIPVGEHILVLILKDKTLASVFGGDPNTGEVIYKLWVKTSIDKSKIIYETNQDTDLLSGLVSDLGNTNGSDIIQTRAKSGTHNATLKTLFSSKMLDEKNSFYVQGNVDSNNDFTETGTHQTLDLSKTEINVDGIYKMHLVDVVGNVYDSYYELGQSNWKIKGTFSDEELNKLSTKLNVTVNLTDPTQKQEAMGWLQNYQSTADSTFNDIVSTKGKGFNITINDLANGYKAFLDPVTYVNTQTSYAINQSKLDKEISDIAEQKLQDNLAKLPQNLNIDTRNVVNKSTLDNYSIWIKKYQDFINKNKDQWINDVVDVASRGFATTDQENQIKNHIASLDFKNYLKHIVWTTNSNLSTSNDYKQFVELDKLQGDTITWVNQNIPEINTAYQNAIKDAESNLNLHGYSINEILNGKKLPQTKSEIDNFADGQSFHNWLQAKADNMYHVWQLKVGLPIGLILLGVTVFGSLACYWKFSARHNPIKRADKKHKPINPKKLKNSKKNDN